MKKRKKVKYTDEPIGKIKIIPDFLPPPEDLILTLVLSKSSIEFFKHLAEKNHTRYQKMIRVLLDKYVANFNK
jgi:predicted DNA binding CopG/RHH family protein